MIDNKKYNTDWGLVLFKSWHHLRFPFSSSAMWNFALLHLPIPSFGLLSPFSYLRFPFSCFRFPISCLPIYLGILKIKVLPFPTVEFTQIRPPIR